MTSCFATSQSLVADQIPSVLDFDVLVRDLSGREASKWDVLLWGAFQVLGDGLKWSSIFSRIEVGMEICNPAEHTQEDLA